MNTRMLRGHGPKRLMRYSLVGLPIIVVGLGLATGRNPQSGVADSYPFLVPVQPPAPAMQMPAPLAAVPALPQQNAPIVPVNQTFPQGLRVPCPPVAASPVAAVALMVPPSEIKVLPFQEAHWQGLEVIPVTPSLRRVMKIPTDARGVIVDEATGPADMEGFLAGDVIVSVGQLPTATLEGFIKAADRVRDRRRTEVELLRKGQLHRLVLTALQQRLGTANGETAPMIKSGSTPPHGYKGACTNCHHIGTQGQLAMDQGDLLTRAAPAIRAGQASPHRDRGVCNACHWIR